MPNDVARNDPEALRLAFLRGAGIAAETIPALSPEMMELVGKLLARQLQGSIDLLAQRSLVKQEAKADLTMVVVRNNNPLKFFQDSQTVLTQMLRKKMPGFMEPLEAVDDACRDLRAHQSGLVTGIRASMDQLLKRLAPRQIEAAQGPGSLAAKLIPGLRPSALWRRYQRTHKHLESELQDQYKAVFGAAFLEAYEQEVERAVGRELGCDAGKNRPAA